ncbi:extracellular solute-binding protein [Paenibacillus filicis]|uniref:Extracellular solute-binding protein n=1 Tax=Paenibacillus gyeongsangnamensis TaxID=3388067 RepID=A0ABT4QG84_9BACL|nr:extracellular solute-binding protein [Paenibacillus filicis]MCZ8515818.1 extracellular solute-binding protein [Paenibacillus filicis]
MFLKKSSVFVLTSMLAIGLVTGCAKNNTSGGEAVNPNQPKKLVIYSNSVSDGRGDWLKEKAGAKGFQVEIVEGGGGDIANRLTAEKNNPVADVVFGLSAIDYENFKAQSLLEKYKPVWADEVTKGLNDKDDYYHSLVKQAILLIYNSNIYNENTAPKDWTDLWNKPEFHNKYDAPSSFGGGTIRAVIAGILVRYQDPNGEYGISQQGWDELKKYLKFGYHAAQGEDFYANLASGKSPLGPMWSSGIATREEKYGVRAGVVKPAIGVPYTVEQVAIIKGTKNLQAAKEFIDWFGSAEVQGEWAKKFSSLPANEKALASAPQAIKDLDASLKVQNIDWAFVSKNINKWVEKIQLQLLP